MDKMSEVNLVICMAGYNTRFHDVGFDIPKYLLPWNGKTIIHEILQNLGPTKQTILVANNRDMYFKQDLINAIQPLGLGAENILYIGDTRGQAHTAAIGMTQLEHMMLPTFIHNADTIITGRDFDEIVHYMDDFYDVYVDVFVGNSPKYSYVRAYEGVVTEIVEKKQISPYASSGFYGFSSASLYLNHHNSAIQERDELYVSDIIQDMIKDDLRACMNGLGNYQDTLVLGSPQEYGIEVARRTLGGK